MRSSTDLMLARGLHVVSASWLHRGMRNVPTLGELHQQPGWVWLHCAGQCAHYVALPLAPFVIRWGADVSSNVLRRNARCTVCGHKGATIQIVTPPSTADGVYRPFPTTERIPIWVHSA